METIGIRAFRADLRTWLDRASAGTVVVITDRGRPVARLGPVGDEESGLNALIAAGLARPPLRPKLPASSLPTIRVKGGLVDILLAQRRGEWREP